MKGYKAFNKGWKCKDFQYELGKIYELPEGQKLEMCKCGFHFCKNPIDVFGYYPMNDDVLIAEVEALGRIEKEGTKYVTDKIWIVKEFTRDQLTKLILSGNHNSGLYNTGICNSGDYNTGICNSGDYNSGNYNTGYCNSGYYNSGNYNSGNYNSGNHNRMNYNTGDYNSGSFNSGNHNSGSCNTGDYNSGDYNAGDYNSGNCNSGIFNTNEPYMRAFNKPTGIKFSDFLASLDYDFYRLCDRILKKSLEPQDSERIKALPNYDANIFEEITGIKI